MKTEKRKLDHIKICLTEEVETGYTGLEDVMLIHHAIPEIDFSEIDTSTHFGKKKLSFPFLIASMTGGHEETEKLNENLAIAVEETGIGMGVGSQRAGLENERVIKTFSIVRERAPKAFIYANIGAPQIINDLEIVDKVIEMIDADAIAIHLNYLQEAIQNEGDKNARGCLEAIEEVCKSVRVPVIVKETGAGISKEVAIKLKDLGVFAIDVGGKGGTSFSMVEAYRSEDEILKDVGFDFADWGIPTAFSIIDCCNVLPTIATGGIRNGLDVAKSLALGAKIASSALPFLAPANISANAVKNKIQRFMRGLKTAMFLTNCRRVEELKIKPLFVTGKLLEWLKFREIDLKAFCEGRR
ncbi:MAG: type 2 isopentenyl-diphosphate Delta-isomerase [Archaeoglobaceae archaeon]|nr:type 2 isopentenyl-diphosphate Delta-isomerase [Archaeoglobaceae archaeon]MDW8128337.1 type 2 isopentenyl-diphosphate Delta-isomerase [Archaeoglobaceae archaeon]